MPGTKRLTPELTDRLAQHVAAKLQGDSADRVIKALLRASETSAERDKGYMERLANMETGKIYGEMLHLILGPDPWARKVKAPTGMTSAGVH